MPAEKSEPNTDRGLPRLNALRARSVDAQAKIAVVLLSLIPALACFYAGLVLSSAGEELPHPAALLVIVACALSMAVAGWLILRKYARNVSRLREYVVKMAAGALPDSIHLYQTQTSDELQCIEEGLNMILREMEKRVKLIETKLKVESGLRMALEQQQQELIKAEQQRVMLHSLGAACHHLGQPTTALRMRLYLMRDRARSIEEMAEIDASFQDLEAIDTILTKLREVHVYRTEPYLRSSETTKSEILAIE